MQEQAEDLTDVVVAGFDGSPDASTALRHAVAEARRRGDRVRVVTVYEPPDIWAYAHALFPLLSSTELRDAAREAARRGIAEVRDGLDDELRAVPVDMVVLPGSPAAVLPDVARGAARLVVGHRGLGRLRSAVIGSVGLSAILRAPCPVTVVPGDGSGEGEEEAGNTAGDTEHPGTRRSLGRVAARG